MHAKTPAVEKVDERREVAHAEMKACYICDEKCSCGTKKAPGKNKTDSTNEGRAVASAGLNAFERYRIAVEESKHSISVRLSILQASSHEITIISKSFVICISVPLDP